MSAAGKFAIAFVFACALLTWLISNREMIVILGDTQEFGILDGGVSSSYRIKLSASRQIEYSLAESEILTEANNAR